MFAYTYTSRVPFGTVWGWPGGARNPLMKLVALVGALLGTVVLVVMAVVSIIIDIVLIPFHLLFGGAR